MAIKVRMLPRFALALTAVPPVAVARVGNEFQISVITGLGTAGGVNTAVQFNDSGIINGDADFTWNKTTNTLGLASGSVINWNAGDVTLTHSANALTFDGADTVYSFVSTQDGNALLQVINSSAGANAQAVLRITNGTNIADLAMRGTNAPSPGRFIISNTKVGEVIAISPEGAEEVHFAAASTYPATSDGNALGNTTNMWSDLFLASGGVINFNNGNVALTHSADTLTLAGGTVLFNTRVIVSADTSIETRRSNMTLSNGLNSDISNTGSFRSISGPTGAFSVGGFTNPTDGLRLTIFNTVGQTMTIVNEDASSTSSNRITTLNSANVVLKATSPSAASFIYDTFSSRWILIAISPVTPIA